MDTDVKARLARPVGILTPVLLAAALLFPLFDASTASLPKSTQTILETLKLNPALLSDIDKELQVPADWIQKAKKEGQLRILDAYRAEKDPFAPFKERYPFIAIEHSSVDRQARSVKALVAFKQGRILADVIFNVGGVFHSYKEANAVEDLRAIPAMKNLPEGLKDPEGFWVSTSQTYWGVAYNTKLVPRNDLPVKWEDFVTQPRWRGGNLALGNRPNQWVLDLWKAKGEKWTKDFLARLFSEVKPQLRKEGMNALPQLAAAGEFHAIIPAPASTVFRLVTTGAPVGFTSPEFVPTSIGDAVIIRGSPNLHAARLFLNWRLSKEGQIALFYGGETAPSHRDLQLRQFVPFPDEILGKAQYQDPVFELKHMPALQEFWDKLWLRGGGELRK